MTGYGLDDGVEMGPVISPQSKTRIEGLIDVARKEGSKVLVDGSGAVISGYEQRQFRPPDGG